MAPKSKDDDDGLLWAFDEDGRTCLREIRSRCAGLEKLLIDITSDVGRISGTNWRDWLGAFRNRLAELNRVLTAPPQVLQLTQVYVYLDAKKVTQGHREEVIVEASRLAQDLGWGTWVVDAN